MGLVRHHPPGAHRGETGGGGDGSSDCLCGGPCGPWWWRGHVRGAAEGDGLRSVLDDDSRFL
jgi:hypothetical protein